MRRSMLGVRLLGGLAVLCGLVGATATGQAQSDRRGFDVQLFMPSASIGTSFTVPRAGVPRHLTFDLGLAASYARAPLDRSEGDANLVNDLGQAELLFALGLFEFLEVGVALPLVYVDAATDPAAEQLGYDALVGPGDARLSLKVPILRGDFALSGRVVTTVPSGPDDHYAGSRYWSMMPGAVVSFQQGSLSLGGELGYRLRQRATLGNLEVDDEAQLGAGGLYRVSPLLGAVAEAHVRLGLGGRSLSGNEVPVEVRGGARLFLGDHFTLDLGVGGGLGSGYGAPAVRGFAIVRYASERELCEAGPEDYDGFLDGDFCADPDNDGDTLLDEQDECPNDSEDPDGFLDQDGCPDFDNDADGVMDGQDACPLVPEDIDNFQDEDGCPELDNDEDGVPDGIDECPMQPEDHDNYQDDDGCPEPGPKAVTVTVTETRILVSERIYFDFDLDTIRSVSTPLLDQVADVMREVASEKRIRVEGYTDSEGAEKYNVDLSYRRARAVVEYLVTRGVPRSRLTFVGYGSKNSVAPNDSPEGRALNRRVEFTILEPGDR